MKKMFSKKVISSLIALVLVLGGYLLTDLGILEPAPTDPTIGTSQTVETPPSTEAPTQTNAPDQQTEAPAQSDSETPAQSDSETPAQSDSETPTAPAEDGHYYSAEAVALYLHTYGHLPENFITKTEARELGWDGGSVEPYAPGCAIGGDKFGNREELLPKASGRQYYECDIDTNGQDSRGAKRLVYSNDGLIYYTDDHYESFTLLYGEE